MMDIEQVAEAVRNAAVQYGARKAVLFGSCANGGLTKHSDIDVIFVEDTSARFVERLGKYMDSLWNQLHISADVLVYTPEELAQISWKPFVKKALAEGMVVYEQAEAPGRGSALAASG